MNKYIIVALFIAALLVLVGCKAGPAETVVTTVTQQATTVTTTVTQPAETVTTTVTQPATTVTTTVTATPTTTSPTTTTTTTTTPTGQLANDQSQVILSEKFEIWSHSSERSDTGVKVIGQVHASPVGMHVLDCEIKVEFYDADGALLETAGQVLEEMTPNATREFEVEYTGSDPQNVASYKIAVDIAM